MSRAACNGKALHRAFGAASSATIIGTGRLTNGDEWQLPLTRDRLDNLVHIGTVRVDRALHHRRWGRGGSGSRPGVGEGKAA